jgi:hypothetical protein
MQVVALKCPPFEKSVAVRHAQCHSRLSDVTTKIINNSEFQKVPTTSGLEPRPNTTAAGADAVWDYQTSPLFTPAERAALDVAVAAGCVPNAVTDEMFLELKKHWTEEQIVAVIAIFGFLNRWNDTMATPLEDEPTHFAEGHLSKHGWTIGKAAGSCCSC